MRDEYTILVRNFLQDNLGKPAWEIEEGLIELLVDEHEKVEAIFEEIREADRERLEEALEDAKDALDALESERKQQSEDDYEEGWTDGYKDGRASVEKELATKRSAPVLSIVRNRAEAQ